MKIKPIDNINFGILQEVNPRIYGEYMRGEYKGHKIEVFNAYKHNQLLIYVSKNAKFLKSKLIYWLDGMKKVTISERRGEDGAVIDSVV